MENTAEFTQGKNLASEKFLTEELHITQLPAEFSFSDEIKYGLLSFEKWSKKSKKEVSGVLFVNTKDKICLKELQKGESWVVPIRKHDLANFSNDKIDKYLEAHDFSDQKYGKEFFLLPKNYSNISFDSQHISIKFLPREHVIERGKRILGAIHTHPSDNPPNSGDFTQVNFGDRATDREFLEGVIAGGNLYLILRTKETPLLEIDVLSNKEDTKTNYEEEMDKKVNELAKNGVSLKDAINKVLVDYCYQNNVALYRGEITENKFKRIV